MVNHMKRALMMYVFTLMMIVSIVPSRVAAEDLITVAVSMEKFTLGQGYIIEPTLVTIPTNTKASVVITDLLHERYGATVSPYKMTGSIHTNFYLAHVLDDGYMKPYNVPAYIVAAIEEEGSEFSLDNDEWLGEFDFFKHSGWMYAINNVFPGVGAAGWTLQHNQVMRWQYTIFGLGADLNANNEAWGTEAIVKTAQKDDLTWRIAEINSLRTEEKAAFLAEANHQQHYERAYEVLTNMESTQADVDAVLQALGGVTRVADEVTGTMPDEALVVNEAIQSLPSNIKLADAEHIANIRKQYEALEATMQQWIWIDEVKRLEAAEQKIEQLRHGVAKVIAQIDALPKAEQFRIEHEAALKAAQTAYALLTKEQQQLVDNAQHLNVLTTQLGIVKAAEQAIQRVIEAIDALPAEADVTRADEAAIEVVKQAYDALSNEQQQAVTNAAYLKALVEQIATLQPEKTAVEHVILLINEATDAASIARAQQAYDALTTEEQARVTNIAILEQAKQQLQATEQAANIVRDLIATIPASSKLETVHGPLLQAIQQAYDALSPAAQALVPNIKELQSAHIAFAALQYKPTDAQLAAGVSKLIEALPLAHTITIAHETIVKEIRLQYDALTKAQQQLVTNEQKLRDIEEALRQADVDVAILIEEIDALPQVVTPSAAEIVAMLRSGYDALTNEQQALVHNVETLIAAEQQLAALTEANVNVAKDWQDAVNASTNIEALTTDEQTLYVTAEQAVTFAPLFLQQARREQIAHIIITQHDRTITLPASLWLHDVNEQSSVSIAFDDAQRLHILERLSNGIERDVTLSQGYIIIQLPLNEGVLVQQVEQTYEAVPHTINDGMATVYVNESTQLHNVTTTKTFADLNGISAKEDIEFLATRYVIHGTSDITYTPTASITRAQFGAMIARALHLQATAPTVYEDTKGMWYEAHIQALYEAGITNATGSFQPNAPLTREHAAAFMFRVLQYVKEDIATTTTLPYIDAQLIQPQFIEAVSTLNTLHIMEGKEGNRFDAKAALTRAQMAKILRRTLQQVNMM